MIYQDCDKLINDKVHPSHGAKLAKNKIHTVAINVYPASIHDISGLKDGEFNECLFVETMGNITNACRGLSLAQKLGFEVVIIGQPLGIAQLLYVYKYRYKLRFPHKIQLIVGGYLSSNTLMRFLKYDICNSIDISWISYYGTTDFFAAVLKTEYNETNGFVSTNPHKIRTQICARTNSLVLTYIDSNGDQTSINTNDYVSKELFEMNGRLYFEPKTRLEQWIINEWGEKQWRYLTGNATICNDIVYLQRRDDDNDDNETYDNNFYLNKGIAYLESDINGKDKDLESISSKFNMVELLPFSEFETKFHSNIFQTKPKYLYTQSNVSNANESSEQKIQFLHLSQSSEL